MQIVKNRKDVTLCISVEGRLDSQTSPQLEAEIYGSIVQTKIHEAANCRAVKMTA